MLQADEPRDYVVGTGEMHSCRELVDIACRYAKVDPESHLVIDPRLFRPAEVDLLVADSSRARAELGWKPEISFEGLDTMMVDADIQRLTATVSSASAGRGPTRPDEGAVASPSVR